MHRNPARQLLRHFEDGSAAAAISDSERLGRRWGVHGTPACLVGQRLVSGLQPVSVFERLAATAG
jgi:predicted DsbA family dithiol-disulfide isomerase